MDLAARYSSESARTQVFTIGAGLKVAAAAVGAALIGLLDGFPLPAQLLLVSAGPLVAGALGTMLLTRGPAREPGRVAPDRPRHQQSTAPVA